MGVRVLPNDKDSLAALYCSTTEIAFGPIFHDSEHYSAEMRAESFLRYLGTQDARKFSEAALLDRHRNWLAQEKEQWKKEEEEDPDMA